MEMPADLDAPAASAEVLQSRFNTSAPPVCAFDRESFRQAQKMEALGRFAAGVAHDFHNLLTVIQGYALLLARRTHDAETAEPLTQIAAAANRGAILTRQLLTYSRREAVNFEPLDLNALVENLTQMLSRLLGEDIVLRNAFGSNLKPVVGDTGMIEQIVMNLAVNARDAMPQGGTLTLSTCAVQIDETLAQRRREAQTGEFVCLKVADSGCGMTPEVLSHLFEPFFTTKPEGRGTGLGLATVADIVNQHSGWVEVSSQPGAGTEFRVYFPSAPGRPVRSQTKSDLPAPAPGHETILLVEDDDVVRRLARLALTQQGYRVIEENSGASALAIWKDHAQSIDLVLTDLVLPGGISGRDLARRLRQTKPNLPVVCTSGCSRSSVSPEVNLLPGATFLAKPYTPDQLLRAVQECLARVPQNRDIPGTISSPTPIVASFSGC